MPITINQLIKFLRTSKALWRIANKAYSHFIFSLPRFLFNSSILRILNLEYVIVNSLYILSFNHKVMNKIGITLATAAALLTVIALVMQLSEPVSAQQQQYNFNRNNSLLL